jgi:hypothetical protein
VPGDISLSFFIPFEMQAFQKSYVLGEQFLFGQHLIRTMDGEDVVQKGINSERDSTPACELFA